MDAQPGSPGLGMEILRRWPRAKLYQQLGADCGIDPDQQDHAEQHQENSGKVPDRPNVRQRIF
jgi:hypothetical protein